MSANSVFPSKMTAFGLKQHGEEGLADGHPFGTCGRRCYYLFSSLISCDRAYRAPKGYGWRRCVPSLFTFCYSGSSDRDVLFGRAALFLASPASAYVSGTHIILDGAATHSRVKAAL